MTEGVSVEALAASLMRKGIITMTTEPTNPQALIREGAEAADLMPPSEARDLIARLTHALESVYGDSLTGQAEHARWQERAEELEAIVNDGGNQAAKYWTRLNAAERERDEHRRNAAQYSLREAQATAERDRYREAIEAARDHEWSGYGKSDTWHILTRALNDEETN